MKIIRVLTDSGQPIFLTEEDNRYVPLPDDFWRRKTPNYRYLTREGKEKQQRKLLKTMEVKNVRVRRITPRPGGRFAMTAASTHQRRQTAPKAWRR